MDTLLTVHRTLAAGPVLRQGTLSDYHALAAGPGEPHLVRADLLPQREVAAHPSRRRGLGCFAHVTDLQLADVQSPARFEHLNSEAGDPRFAALVPMHRPQESLTSRAVDAMVRALNAVPGGPVTGVPMSLVVTTGDAIDNAQWNELQLFLALLDGGVAWPGSGGSRYEGVQSTGWPEPLFWTPDRTGLDPYQRDLGFPSLPGVVEDALLPFAAPGLRVPWLGCFGNHEALVQGVGTPTPALHRHAVAGRKAHRSPEGMDRDRPLASFLASPERFAVGPYQQVTADPARRFVTRRDFVAAHFGAGSRPHGHGFGERNLRDGTAYYTWDEGPLRFVCLDTNCFDGGGAGCIDEDQLRWLEGVLQDSSSGWSAPDGSPVRSGSSDRLVVLFSHHGSDQLSSGRGHLGTDGVRLAGSGPLLELLHRYPNVVLWLNGHTHVNAVRPHPRPGGGFWEVSTCAVVDWPSQSRVVELADNGDGTLSVLTTMLDHEGPVVPAPRAVRDGDWLAGVHRELAANVPGAGLRSANRGLRTDRNVDLRLPAPFPPAPRG